MDLLTLKRDRDAWATIRGYVYQVDLTVEHWIQLQDNEVLELERGEDIDLIGAISGSGERLMSQIKHREKNITLRSTEAIEALVNFYEHRQENRHLNLSFRFLTNAIVAVERPSLFPDKTPAITVWENIRILGALNNHSLEQLYTIRDFLLTCSKPKSVTSETWQQWKTFLNDASDIDLLAFVQNFIWSTQHTSFDQIDDQIIKNLLRTGMAKLPHEAENIYERLFLYVFKVLSKPGIKRLTRENLISQLQRTVLNEEESELLIHLRLLWRNFEERVDGMERALEEQGNRVEILNDHVSKLKDEVGFHASISLDVQRPVLDTPEFDRIILRQELVNSILEQTESIPWLALYGDLGSGKTHLASLLAKQSTCRGWIRLRDLNPTYASLRIDDALLTITGVTPNEHWKKWYIDVCVVLGRNALLVLDDLPRTNGKTLLDEKLILLSRACQETGVKMISTSAFPPPSEYASLTSDDILKPFEVPKFIEREVKDLLEIYHSPKWLIENTKFLSFIVALTKGHPVLVTAAIRYLQERKWNLDDESLSVLFKGDFTGDLNIQIQHELMDHLEDSDTREFLYRLTLVQAPFDIEHVRIISEVDPPILRPLERVADVSGLWVQKDTDTNYLVSPLLTQIGPMNLDITVKKQVHYALGQHIIRKRQIHPSEAIRALGHFVSAESYREAGLTLLVSLNQIEKHLAWSDDWGFTKVWVETPLPKEMDSEIKVAIRMRQIMIFKKMKRPTDWLLQELDLLLTNTDIRNVLVSSAALYAASLHALSSPEKAISYLDQAINVVDNALIQINGQENETAETHHPSELIWIIGAGIRTGKQVEYWLRTLERFTENQLHYAKQSRIYAESAISICDRIWLEEADKPKDLQKWEEVLGLLEKITNCASKIGLEILWACSIRSRIIVSAEYLNDLQSALKFANSALKHASDNKVVQYIINESMGRQYVYKSQSMEAIPWLTRALQSEINIYPLQRINTYIELSKAFGEYDVSRATYFTEKAIEISMQNEEVSETEVVKATSEHIIALWLNNELEAAIPFYEDVVERLLRADKDDNTWKSLFAAFGHFSGYIISQATRGVSPAATFDGKEYLAPNRGFFMVHRPQLASLYNPQNDFFLALHIGLLVDHFDKKDRAAYWTLKSFDLAKRNGARENLGLLGVQAVPILLYENQFANAFDLAFETQILFEIYKRGLSDHIDPRLSLGSSPSDIWDSIEQSAAEVSIILAVLRILELHTHEPTRTHELIMELDALCRQIKITASSPSFWGELVVFIETLLENNLSFGELVSRGNAIQNWSCIKFLYYVAASLKATPLEALRIYHGILPFLETSYRNWEGLQKRIITPFVTGYWRNVLYQYQDEFLAPDYVATSIDEFSNGTYGMDMSKLLKAIKFGIDMRF